MVLPPKRTVAFQLALLSLYTILRPRLWRHDAFDHPGCYIAYTLVMCWRNRESGTRLGRIQFGRCYCRHSNGTQCLAIRRIWFRLRRCWFSSCLRTRGLDIWIGVTENKKSRYAIINSSDICNVITVRNCIWNWKIFADIDSFFALNSLVGTFHKYKESPKLGISLNQDRKKKHPPIWDHFNFSSAISTCRITVLRR